MYIIDPKSKISLHLQLYQQMKEEIITSLKVGDKLSSIRKVATLYNLSKTTVESAYSQLYAEGYIVSRPKSGYFVSDFHFGEIVCSSQFIRTPSRFSLGHSKVKNL